MRSRLLSKRAAHKQALEGFHSALEKVLPDIEAIADKEGGINPQQAISWLQARQREGKFKKEELEAVGLIPLIQRWERENPGEKITLDQLMDGVQSNFPDVQAHSLTRIYWFYGTDGSKNKFQSKAEAEKAFEAEQAWCENESTRISEGEDSIEATDYNNETLFIAYRNDEQEDPDEDDAWYYEDDPNSHYSDKIFCSRDEAKEAAEEAAQKTIDYWLGEMSREIEEEDDGGRAQYEDYKQPGGEDYYQEHLITLPNHRRHPAKKHLQHYNGRQDILAHTRFQTFKDEENKYVLFVDEIQSDWANLGREKGFDDEDEEKVPHAPFVKDTKAWMSLVIRYIIRHAVNEGFKRVAFVTGEQSAKRYSLDDDIEALDYKYNSSDKTYTLVVDSKTVGERVPNNQLKHYVGQEIAQQIIDGVGDDQPDGYKRLEGDGLHMGGERLRVLYDSIVPNVLRGVLKKLGGNMTTIYLKSEGSRGPWVPHVGFDITTEMERKVHGGLPLFASRIER